MNMLALAGGESTKLIDVTSRDYAYSAMALVLAEAGVGMVSPNPLVGCVIVSSNDQIVGEGTYTYDGVTHAEMIALEQAGEAARGGTAYVSLEPHSHYGRTPPCADALIQAGISRVVAPIEDPNPLVSGRGFQKLRDSGIEVVTGMLSEEATRLNEKFICWHKNGRPFVHLKLAMSLDGRISLNKSMSTGLSSEIARSRVHSLRHEHDAILVGSNTAVVDDPLLTDRSGKPRRRQLLRIVLDNRLRISADSRIAQTAGEFPTIIFTKNAEPEKAEGLRKRGVNIVELEQGSRGLSDMLKYLAARQFQSVLVEGGTEVAGAFIDARLVDKVTFICAPVIIGGPNAPNAIGGRGAADLSTAFSLRDITVERLGEDIAITGYPKES